MCIKIKVFGSVLCDILELLGHLIAAGKHVIPKIDQVIYYLRDLFPVSHYESKV